MVLDPPSAYVVLNRPGLHNFAGQETLLDGVLCIGYQVQDQHRLTSHVDLTRKWMTGWWFQRIPTRVISTNHPKVWLKKKNTFLSSPVRWTEIPEVVWQALSQLLWKSTASTKSEGVPPKCLANSSYLGHRPCCSHPQQPTEMWGALVISWFMLTHLTLLCTYIYTYRNMHMISIYIYMYIINVYIYILYIYIHVEDIHQA